MHAMPHHYLVSASANAKDDVEIVGSSLPPIESAPPAEFGGPGDRWSPETLLVAAVADCFILSFRAIARASRVDWTNISCDVEGVLDTVDKVTQFTVFKVNAQLVVPADTDEAKAMRLLEKAEHVCLITNSLKAGSELEASVTVAG